jgi:hypothetical protein
VVNVNAVCAAVAVNSSLFSLTVAGVAGAVELQVVPLEVNTFPLAPGATTCKALVPLPNKTLLDAKDVAPVPPLATGTVVKEMAVPEILNGLVAVETPVTGAAAQLGIPEANVNIWPSVPFANKLVAPAAVW